MPLNYRSGGSVDLYIRHDSPGPEPEKNWLPAPAATFNLMIRLYWPKDEILSGAWIPPGVSAGR